MSHEIINYSEHRRLARIALFSKIINNDPFRILVGLLYKINPKYADFNFADNSTPLLLSCRYYNRVDFIDYLVIEKKCDVNYAIKESNDSSQTDFTTYFKEGTTPLMAALSSEHPEKDGVVSLLLENGARVNSMEINKCSPLMYAVCYAELSAVILLLLAGSNIESKNSNGISALTLSYKCDKLFIFRELVDQGANIDEFFVKIKEYGELSVEEIMNSNKVEMLYYAKLKLMCDDNLRDK